MRVLNLPLEDLKDKYQNLEFLLILKDLDIMKHQQKNIRGNYNKEEKQEEDDSKKSS